MFYVKLTFDAHQTKRSQLLAILANDKINRRLLGPRDNKALYYALFDEVTEAKSLLEQVALVSRGRTMYSTCLSSIERYVKDDLLGGTTLAQAPTSSSSSPTPSSSSITPSLILSARPADDPLEAILYLTSVGLPGQIYDTVRSLRQARSRRLGALQRKVPVIHLLMLWILGLIMISSFPVLIGVSSAQEVMVSTTATGISKACTLQGALFGVATFAVVMTKMVLGELWRTKGGAYNVDSVLRVMVRGLQKELNERMTEAQIMMKRSNTNDVKSVRERGERDNVLSVSDALVDGNDALGDDSRNSYRQT